LELPLAVGVAVTGGVGKKRKKLENVEARPDQA
jgi:hypothetical protein